MCPMLVELLLILLICVFGTNGVLYVLVNREEIHFTYLDNDKVNYYYVEGDVVDVTCLNLQHSCAAKLTYHYWEERLPDYNKFNTADKSLSSAVGLNITLEAENNQSQLICESICGDRNFKIAVTFVLFNNTQDDVLGVKVDDYALRAQPTRAQRLTLYFSRVEIVNIKCETKIEKIICKMYIYTDIGQTAFEESCVKKISPFDDSKVSQTVKCEVWKKNSVANVLDITFKEIPIELADRLILTMDVPSDRVLVKLHQYNGDQLIFYQFKAGDIITMTCSVSLGSVSSYGNHLVFNNKESKDKDSIIIQIKLHSGDDNRTIDCQFLRKENNTSIGLVRVLFREQRPPLLHEISNNTTVSANDDQLLLYGILGVAGGVLCVSATICYMKRRIRRLQKTTHRDSCEYQLCDDDNPIPHYPTQWDPQLSDSDDLNTPQQVTYSQVLLRDSRPSKPPKPSRNQREGAPPELNYAVLEITPSGRTPKWDSEDSPYAEVIHGVNARLRIAD